MNFLFLLAVFGAIPIAWYFWREHKLNTPSLQWPDMHKLLGLLYEADPPRMGGTWISETAGLLHYRNRVDGLTLIGQYAGAWEAQR